MTNHKTETKYTSKYLETQTILKRISMVQETLMGRDEHQMLQDSDWGYREARRCVRQKKLCLGKIRMKMLMMETET